MSGIRTSDGHTLILEGLPAQGELKHTKPFKIHYAPGTTSSPSEEEVNKVAEALEAQNGTDQQ